MLLNGTICECDIKHAAVAIWYDMGLITEEKYNSLLAMDKKSRVIETGYMRKDNHELTEALYSAYKIYKDKLLKANNIEEYHILETAHDAVWLIDCIPEHRKFGYVEYDIKGIYTLYFKFDKLGFYLDQSNILRTRGVKHLENSSFLNLIQDIMCDYEYGDLEKCYERLHTARINLEKNLMFYGESLGVSPDLNLRIIRRMIKEFLKK